MGFLCKHVNQAKQMSTAEQQADKLALNVLARRVANEIVELGCTLAREEGLAEHPEHVRRCWQYVMETCADLIGDRVIEENKPVDRTPNVAIHPLSNVTSSLDDEPFPFGKHKDEPYGKVPDSYFRWLSKQDWIEHWPEVLDYIQENDLD